MTYIIFLLTNLYHKYIIYKNILSIDILFKQLYYLFKSNGF
jgi:hypothetical protein